MTDHSNRAEISHDLIDEPAMRFMEGSFRIDGGPWRVYIFSTFKDVSEPFVAEGTWKNGVLGVQVDYPRHLALDRDAVCRVLGERFGVTEWTTVKGPDSMTLR